MAEMKTMTINGEQFVLPFAPAGLVKGYNIASSLDLLKSVLSTCFAGMANNTAALFQINITSSGVLPVAGVWNYTIHRQSSTYGLAVGEYIYNGQYYKVIQKFNDGAWGELEYDNPPMVLGVEYRTTERWQGKPVYAKLVDCGELPAPGVKKSVTGFAPGIYWAVRVNFIFKNTSTNRTYTGLLDEVKKYNFTEGYSSDSGRISITGDEGTYDNTVWNAQAFTYYTKS